MTPTLHSIDKYLVRCLMKKYKRFKPKAGRIGSYMPSNSINRTCSPTGTPWRRRLDDWRRMSREVHVRFCESLELRLLRTK